MESSTPKILLRSLLFSYVLSGLLLVATSFALYKFRLKESQVKLAVNVIYLLSCALAGFLMGKGLQKRRFLWLYGRSFVFPYPAWSIILSQQGNFV